MKRRDFLALTGAASAAAAFPRVALAQQGKVPRIAVATNQPIADISSPAGVAAFNSLTNLAVFLSEMARLGFVEGQTVTFERYSSPGPDQQPVARAIVASKP